MKWKWIECISYVHYVQCAQMTVIFGNHFLWISKKMNNFTTWLMWILDSLLWSPSHEVSAIVYPKMCVCEFGGCRIDADAWSLITQSELISERCKLVCWTISTFPAFSRAVSGLRWIKYNFHYSPLVVVEIICRFVYSCVACICFHFVEPIWSWSFDCPKMCLFVAVPQIRV